MVPQSIPGGDIYPALEKGTIDAAEWVGPYDDQKLGFNKVAQYYYYPGWWKAGALDSMSDQKAYEALPNDYKEAIAAACGEITSTLGGQVRRAEPKALRELVASGTKFLPFPQPVLEACFNAANELYAEIGPRTPSSRRSTRTGRRSGARKCCGSASSRTPSTTSWRASRPATSSERAPPHAKSPASAGLFFARGACRMAS